MVMKHGANEGTRSRHTVRNVIVTVVVVLFVLVATGGILGYHWYKQLYAQAMQVKALEKEAVSLMQRGDSASNEDYLAKIQANLPKAQQNTAQARQIVHGADWNRAAKLPKVGGDIIAVQTLADVADTLISDVVPQFGQVVSGLESASLTTEDGNLNLQPISDASQQMASVNSTLQQQVAVLDSVKEPVIAKIRTQYDDAVAKIRALAEQLNGISALMVTLPSFAGASGARTYAILAQTTSEARSTGGLVGSMGSLTMNNGVISVNDFYADAQWPTNSGLSDVTDSQATLFRQISAGLVYGSVVHNMTTNPNFPDVAQQANDFWKAASFGGNGTDCDGVLSLDPYALQQLIGVSGDITMPDGRVLNGTNTAQFLLHDVYNELPVSEQDTYFAAVVAQVVKNVFTDMNVSKLMKLSDVLLDAAKGNHVYMWSFHTEDQQALRDAGLTGEVGTDPSKPEVGVYMQQMHASKLDWYTSRTATLTKSNETTYHVHYTFANTLTSVDGQAAYIVGTDKDSEGVGQSVERVYLYAPAGGHISNVSVSSGSAVNSVNVDGHDVSTFQATIGPGESVSVDFDVQCASGAQKLTLRQTPSGNGESNIDYQY